MLHNEIVGVATLFCAAHSNMALPHMPNYLLLSHFIAFVLIARYVRKQNTLVHLFAAVRLRSQRISQYNNMIEFNCENFISKDDYIYSDYYCLGKKKICAIK